MIPPTLLLVKAADVAVRMGQGIYEAWERALFRSNPLILFV